MNIKEKRKLLYYMVSATKTYDLDGEWEGDTLVNTLDLPAIKIKVKEYRPFGNAYDIHVSYLDKEHLINIRSKSFDYDIFEQTNNNFWGVFDEITIKMLLG